MPDALPLRDIHLPDAVSAWPPAIGWWLLAALAIAGLVFAYVRYRRYRVRRAALASLRGIARRYRSDGDERRLAAEVSTLLRRVCITYGPRRDVASLTGDRWLEALAGVSGPGARFSDEVAGQVCQAPYDPAASIDAGALLAQTRRWVRGLPPLAKAA